MSTSITNLDIAKIKLSKANAVGEVGAAFSCTYSIYS